MARPCPSTDVRDEGVTLVAAMSAALIGLSLTVLMTTMVIVTSQDTGLDRKRAVAVGAAEAGVDAAYAAIRSSGAAPPCTWTTSGTIKASDSTAMTIKINYFDAGGAPLNSHCVLDGSGVPRLPASVRPAVAQIVSTADTANGDPKVGLKGKRTMEAQVNLTPQFADSMDDAIFANATLQFANNSRVYGNTGTDANIYSNNAIFCQNGNSSTQFDGSFYSQGSVSLANRCTIMGDLWAVGNIALNNNQVAVAGYVRSSGGTISGVPEQNGTMVAKLVQARAPGAGQSLGQMINWDTCWTSSNRTTLRNPARCQWVSSVAPPPVHPFPVIRGDAAALAAWQADGYTIVRSTDASMDPTCSKGQAAKLAGWNWNGGINWMSNWILNQAPLLGGKTLVVSHCEIRFQNMGNRKVELNNDLAVFARAGFTTAGATTFRSTSATQRVMHIVVPYDATGSPMNCASPTIALDNQTSIEPSVNTLLYTPCNSYVANNSTFTGQIYAGGSMNVNNQFVMQFRKVPMPTGSVVAVSTTVKEYSVDVVYKRENRNPAAG